MFALRWLFCCFSCFSGIAIMGNCANSGQKVVKEPNLPNIIVFFVDDFGWGDFGANINSSEHTPNMNKLAESGLRFTDFHVASSVCSPSRASLLTGRLGLRNGVTMLFGPSNVGGLPLSEIVLPQYLKAAGYSSFAVGKWHLGHHGEYHPTRRGFDHWFGVPYSLDQGCVDFTGDINPECLPCEPPGRKLSNATFCNFNHLALPLFRNSKVIRQPLDFRTLSDFYVSEFDRLVKRFVKKGKPLFGYVPFSHLHVPIGYNTRFSSHSKSKFLNTLFELDSSIGRMMETLDSTGILNNTIIWLLGDNGPWETQCKFAGLPGPFTGLWQKDPQGGGGGTSWKLTVWEGGHRVPGLVSWPGKIQPGVSDALVSSLDILPTTLNIAGLKMPGDRHFDGIDISELIFGKSKVAHEVLYHPRSDGKSGDIDAVRYKNFKAVYVSGGQGLKDCDGKTGAIKIHNPPLLFNIGNDPAEQYPLDTSLPVHERLVNRITGLLRAKLKDIASDLVSTVDMSTSDDVKPCCNKAHENCRC